jgi:hypothetical protein
MLFEVKLKAGEVRFYKYVTWRGPAPDNAVASNSFSLGPALSGLHVVTEETEANAAAELVGLRESSK